MGIIEKQISKSRTKPESFQIPADSPYTRDSNLEFLAQSIASELAGSNASSTAARGYSNAFAGLLAPSSTVWYEISPPSFSLGTRDQGGNRATDWRICLIASSGNGGRSVSVETPEYLTRDGNLVNAAPYKEARRKIADALTSGKLPNSQVADDVFGKGVALESGTLTELEDKRAVPLRAELFINADGARDLFERDMRFATVLAPVGNEPSVVNLGTQGSSITFRWDSESNSNRLRVSVVVKASGEDAADSYAVGLAGSILSYLRQFLAGGGRTVTVEGDWGWVR